MFSNDGRLASHAKFDTAHAASNEAAATGTSLRILYPNGARPSGTGLSAFSSADQARSTGRGGATEARMKELMLASLDGNARAHSSLLHMIRPLLNAFINRRLHGDPSEVEDLVQETLIAVHSRRASFDRSRPFAPWLFAIARRKLVDHFRRSRKHIEVESLADILRVESFEEASNARFDINRLLGTLPSKQARVIRAMKLAGLSAVEAAREAGIGVSDAKVSVHRGLRRLTDRVALGC